MDKSQKIIGVIQLKGGAGRSTIATNLAGYFATKGQRVALIDCDMPQGTAAAWGAVRATDDRPIVTIATAATHQELVQQAKALQTEHDVLILDCPPRIAELTKAAIILSDLCLVPLATSVADVWATSDLVPTIKAAQAVKKTEVRIVWNRYRQSTKLAQELSEEAEKELGLPSMKARLGHRVAYAEAMARGLTVTEWADQKAAEELAELGSELNKLLRQAKR